MRRMSERLSRILSVALLVAVALLIWRIFFPALMSADSFAQFRQAWDGAYTDWHPPLMAIVLHLLFRLGHGIGAITCVQCVAGMLGLRALVLAWLAAFFGPEVPPRRVEGIAVAVALFLVLPLSPLPFYLVTFWKDSWATVLLLWTCAVALRLVAASSASAAAEAEWRTGLRVVALVLLSALLGMVRHNAIVVLPVAGLVLATALWRRSRTLAVALAVAPLLVCVVGDRAIQEIYRVRPVHLERLLMAFDLAGVCALDEKACAELPYTRSHLDLGDLGELRERYVPGDVGRFFARGLPVLDGAEARPDPLRVEYLGALRRFPGLLARVKVEAFAPLIDPQGSRLLIYPQLDGNEFGLRLNSRFATVRAALTRATLWAGEKNALLRPVSGLHLVWLVANVLWIVILPAFPRRRTLALVLLMPLAFYLSYLLAAPEPDYRFMYPSTLALQGVTFSWLLGSACAWFSRNHS
jgi:hypothetical protein